MKKKDETDFTAVASHQLRTPLTIMKGYLSMMLEGEFGKLTPKLKAALLSVYQSNERLVRLVDNLLGLSQFEGKKLKLHREMIDVTQIARATVAEMKPRAAAKKLALKVIGTSTMVSADPILIRQVILNLLDNAIKYTKKGSVTIEVGSNKKQASVSVIDTGPGLTASQLKGIFKKFARRDVKGSSEEGFGLGLYICQLIISTHTGTIRAKKNRGPGLTITVELPY